jgi:PPM family protein phosphatase
MGRLMLDAVGLSDTGCVRTNNEDYYVVEPKVGLYLVADGMGGAQAGEHASKLAAETVCEVVSTNGTHCAEVLVKAFQEANRRVLLAAAEDVELEGMGTTLVAALECGEDVLIASVGDSRAYVFDGARLIVITEDQTWVHEVGRRLGLDEASLKTHPMRHVLTMAIGVSSDLRVHTYAIKAEPGLQLLLCSDGLHGVVDESVIAKTLAGPDELREKCTQLVERARTAGGPDNITTVLLAVH